MASNDSVDRDELYTRVFTPHDALVPLRRTATPQLAFHDESHYKKNVEVLYVNGINTGENEARLEAKTFAFQTHHDVKLLHDMTRGKGRDVLTAFNETVVPGFSESQLPEQLLAAELLRTAAKGHDVHVAAYSRGALITQKAVELADAKIRFEERHDPSLAEVKIAAFHKHITLETFNGASHQVADGIRAVHYVNRQDFLVGQTLGFGERAPEVRALMALTGAVEPLASPLITAYLARSGAVENPGGPIYMVDPKPGEHGMGQHSIFDIMNSPQFKPFEQAYRPYAKQLDVVATMAHPMSPQPPSELTRAVESMPLSPDPSPMTAPSVNGRNERLPDDFKPIGTLRASSATEIDLTIEKDGRPEVLKLPRKELFDGLPQPEREKLEGALRQNHAVVIGLDHQEVVFHPAVAQRPEMTMFRNGQAQRVPEHFHETGKLSAHGTMVSMTIEQNGKLESVVFSKAELFAGRTEDEKAKISKAIEKHATVTLDFDTKSPKLNVTIPDHGQEVARSPQRARTNDRSDIGHQL